MRRVRDVYECRSVFMFEGVFIFVYVSSFRRECCIVASLDSNILEDFIRFIEVTLFISIIYHLGYRL